MSAGVLDRVARRLLVRQGFRSRRIRTSVGNVHVLDGEGTGSGPPIVLIHGICAAAVHYRSVLPRLLARSRRVIAPDLPAHGFSDDPPRLDRDSLRAGLLEALTAVLHEPAIVFGNSLGGAAAVELATTRPDRVRGLILSSPGGARVPAADLQVFLDGFRFGGLRDARDFVDKLHVSPPWYAPLLAHGVKAQFDRAALRGFIDRLTIDDLLDPRDLASIAAPVLLLWGRADRVMPLEHYAFYRQHLPPHARFEDPDFGHCPYLDRPAALADRILAFADEVQA